ncbi:MAG: hypothetical protein AB7U82_08320 [Blastocatellales bacterium]
MLKSNRGRSGDNAETSQKQYNVQAQPTTLAHIKSIKSSSMFVAGRLCSRCGINSVYATLDVRKLFALGKTSGEMCATCWESLRRWWAAGQCEALGGQL